MKIREIISENNTVVNEKLGLGLIGRGIWIIFKTFNLARPVVSAWNNMHSAMDSFNRKEPGFTKEKIDEVIAHELAQCSASIATMLIGGKLIDKVVFGVLKFAGNGAVVNFLKDTLSTMGQAKFLLWVNSEEVVKIISDWLTGTLFSEKFPILNKTGPLYEKYVGEGLLGALRAASPFVDKAREKVFGPEEPTKSTPAPGQGATTTPATAQGAERDMGTYMKSVPSVTGDPNKFNITWKR